MPITVARERKTPTDMPLLNSKGAPKKFYGDFDEVAQPSAISTIRSRSAI
jgi:hypothetical protein